MCTKPTALGKNVGLSKIFTNTKKKPVSNVENTAVRDVTYRLLLILILLCKNFRQYVVHSLALSPVFRTDNGIIALCCCYFSVHRLTHTHTRKKNQE